MSPHSYTLSWFRANQSLLFLLNAASSSGHYCVNLLDASQIDRQSKHTADEILSVDSNMRKKKKVLNKLHKQFGHASADWLSKLLKSSGTTNLETIKLLEN
jgi:hypothetical protein